ncbi:MAG: GntR family transcriptional regulator [Rhizobiales bacterium]|nr:GntR family transcriptional regulator [Hyphomicrobiales bacterium]
MQIEKAIKNGLLPEGAVLTEDPIAKLFGSSRTPVRTALGYLSEQGLLKRFEGRGFVIAGDEGVVPLRINLTYEMLGLSKVTVNDAALLTSARVFKEFEDALIHALPFGKFRINEQAAADYFQVSRTVIRDSLSRLLVRGIVKKDPRSHWIIGPLTAAEVAHYYSIRSNLEPLALLESAPLISENLLDEMLDRLKEAQESPDGVSADQLSELETDLHTTLLSKSPNPHLLRMVNQSQLALVVNHVFASFVGTRPFEGSWQEHALIFNFVKRGSYKLAAQALEEHLNRAADRTAKRLMAVSVFPPSETKSYLMRMDS